MWNPSCCLMRSHIASNAGFGSLDYRWEVAYGLSTLVKRTKTGFPDSICELLQTWLVDDTGSGYQEDLKKSDSAWPRSILLHGGYGWGLPSRELSDAASAVYRLSVQTAS